MNHDRAQKQNVFLQAVDAAMAKDVIKEPQNALIDIASGHSSTAVCELKPYTRIVELTPDDARAMLEGNSSNRPLSKTVVERYAHDMSNGSWQMNGETIKISTDGRVIDGQHRLYAIILSGATITTMVTYDLDFNVFHTIDGNLKRTAGHVFAIAGEKHYSHLSTAVRLYARYERDELEKPDNTITTADIRKTLRDHPRIRESVDLASKNYTKLVSIATAAACHYIFSTINRDDADTFILKMLTGFGTGPQDPVHLLRARLIENSASKAKLRTVYIIALIFKSWNCFREGKPVKSLRYRTEGTATESFPVPK